MRIEHLAIWVKDIEAMRSFYMKYFNMKSNEMYVNKTKGFSSYFLTLDSGARLELMHRADIVTGDVDKGSSFGLTHFAISLGSKDKVDELTEQLRSEKFKIIGEPRTTGDGYYESVIADPEGNHIELTQ